MGSVKEEITRLETAKKDIETAIETCGVNVPDTELIDTYASYIRQIPSAVFSGLNVDPVGGADQFIQSIKQTNGLIEATVGGLVSTSSSGLVPKADGSAGVINSPSDDYVLTYKGGTIDWYKLPANAFKNDNNNTTYTLSGALNGNAYDVTLTPSSGSATGAKVPAMGAASSSAAGTAGLVPAPAKNQHNSFLRGDGTWVVPDNTTYSVMTGATASAAGKSGLVPQPAKGDQGKFLSGAGTWTSLPSLSITDSESGNAVTDVEVSGHGITLKRGTTFSVNGHKHSSDDITALTNYIKATTASAIASTDSLNSALGKLEYKADLGKTAYDIVNAANDGDGTIENLKEILKVLEGISDTDTIQAIIGKYLPLEGGTMTGNILLGGGNAIIGSGNSIPAKFKDSASISPEVHSLWLAAVGTGSNNTAGSEASGILFDGNTIKMWSPLDNAPQIIDSDNGTAYNLLHSGNSSVSKSGQTLTVKINGVEQSITNSTYSTLPNPYNISFKDTSNNTVNYNGSSALDLTGGIYYAYKSTRSDTVLGYYTTNGGQQNPNYFGTNRVGFLMMNTTVNGDSHYKDWLIMDCYGGNDAGGGVAFGVNRQKLGAYIMRSEAARTSWKESAELIGTHNYTDYTVKKDGTGASGTWGINITGSATDSDKLDGIDSTGFLKYVTQNATFSSVANISTDLAPGIHRIHISGVEYSSILTGKDFNGSYWQLYFHPSSGYTQDIKYRATNCTTWKTLLDSNNWSSFITIPSVGNGTVTINQAGASKGSFTLNQSTAATIDLTDTNYYPTAFSWTGGTTAGPTGSLTGTGMSPVSFGAIPSASASASGIVTTAAQSFAGVKTFTGKVELIGGGSGSMSITYDKAALVIGTMSRAGSTDEYYPGIAFNHMYGYAGGSGYRNHAHAWIGLRLESTPGSELSSLIFATQSTTTTGTALTERMCITSEGTVGIGAIAPNTAYKLYVNGHIYGSKLYSTYIQDIHTSYLPFLVGRVYKAPGGSAAYVRSGMTGLTISQSKNRIGRYVMTITNNTGKTVYIHTPMVIPVFGDWGSGSCYESPFAYLDHNYTYIFPTSIATGKTLQFAVICGKIHTQGSWSSGDFTKSNDDGGFSVCVYGSWYY